jgi:hypothetical protein
MATKVVTIFFTTKAIKLNQMEENNFFLQSAAASLKKHYLQQKPVLISDLKYRKKFIMNLLVN